MNYKDDLRCIWSCGLDTAHMHEDSEPCVPWSVDSAHRLECCAHPLFAAFAIVADVEWQSRGYPVIWLPCYCRLLTLLRIFGYGMPSWHLGSLEANSDMCAETILLLGFPLCFCQHILNHTLRAPCFVPSTTTYERPRSWMVCGDFGYRRMTNCQHRTSRAFPEISNARSRPLITIYLFSTLSRIMLVQSGISDKSTYPGDGGKSGFF